MPKDDLSGTDQQRADYTEGLRGTREALYAGAVEFLLNYVKRIGHTPEHQQASYYLSQIAELQAQEKRDEGERQSKDAKAKGNDPAAAPLNYDAVTGDPAPLYVPDSSLDSNPLTPPTPAAPAWGSGSTSTYVAPDAAPAPTVYPITEAPPEG
jgi:hypothetical protein